MKNKKGSHVGVVISFTVFITFLFFLYLIIEPVATKERSKQYLLDHIRLNLIENSTVNYTSVTISVSTPTDKDCINTNQVGSDKIPDEYNDKLIVINPDGESLDYFRSGQGFKIKTGVGFVGVLKVYFSDEINNPPVNPGGCNTHTVEVGVVKSYKQIFQSKIGELKDSYTLDYEALKTKLGIPKGTEFNFYLLDIDRNIIFSAEKQTPPETIDVYVDETPIQYMDDSGAIKFGFLRIIVW